MAIPVKHHILRFNPENQLEKNMSSVYLAITGAIPYGGFDAQVLLRNMKGVLTGAYMFVVK